MSIENFTRKLTRLRLVAGHIDQHLGDELRLDDLADIAHISRYHFERVFADYSGETPVARVRRLRLELARRKIVAGAAPSLLELAFDTGYNSAEAFSRAFKAQFGVPPSKVPVLGPPPPAPLRIEFLPPLAIQFLPFSGLMDAAIQPFDELRARALQSEVPRERRKGWSVHLRGGLEVWEEEVEIQAALLSDPLGMQIQGLQQGCLPSGHYAVFTIEGGFNAPPRAELARRIASETEWHLADGAFLRRFQNAAYLPGQLERRYELYVPVAK